jgi:hypothetical protein
MYGGTDPLHLAVASDKGRLGHKKSKKIAEAPDDTVIGASAM